MDLLKQFSDKKCVYQNNHKMVIHYQCTCPGPGGFFKVKIDKVENLKAYCSNVFLRCWWSY